MFLGLLNVLLIKDGHLIVKLFFDQKLFLIVKWFFDRICFLTIQLFVNQKNVFDQKTVVWLPDKTKTDKNRNLSLKTI